MKKKTDENNGKINQIKLISIVLINLIQIKLKGSLKIKLVFIILFQKRKVIYLQ